MHTDRRKFICYTANYLRRVMGNVMPLAFRVGAVVGKISVEGNIKITYLSLDYTHPAAG